MIRRYTFLLRMLLFSLVLMLNVSTAWAQQSSRMRIALFSPDAPPVEVYLDGVRLNLTALEYPNSTTWMDIRPGRHTISLVEVDALLGGTVAGPFEFTAAPGQWITLSASGSHAVRSVRLQPVAEDHAPTAFGTARITALHTVENLSNVAIWLNDDLIIESLSLNSSSPTFTVPAGSWRLRVTSANATEPVYVDAPTANFAESTHYLLAVFGYTTNIQVALRATAIAPGPFPPAEITATAFAQSTAFALTPTATATLDPPIIPTATITPPPTITPFPSTTPAALAVVIAGQPVEVRSAPDINASVIDFANPITRIFVLAQNNDGTWLLIRLSNGREGWVPTSTLRMQR